MSGSKSTINLRSLGVVILAETHNPTILNPDFVATKLTTPDKWNYTQAITTPGLAILTFDNGVELTVDPSRLNITQMCDNPPFQSPYDSKIHAVADAYVRTLPHIPYKSLGLNYVASIIRDNPRAWITEQFLKPIPKHSKLQMLPHFIMEREDNVLRLGFSYQDRPKEQILIDCNVHYNGPFDTKTLRTKISEWPDHQIYINTIISDLMQRD